MWIVCPTTIVSNIIGNFKPIRTIKINSYTTQVVKELSKSKPSFNEIRQIIANANVQDFEELYRFLYDNASAYAAGSEGMVAIYVNEYSYQSNFRIDKEINCMALIARLIELK